MLFAFQLQLLESCPDYITTALGKESTNKQEYIIF